MLQNPHFYHQLTRKAVILFGRLFDDVYIVRKNNQTGKEVNRFVVPIIYSPKEKMVTRLFSDPDLLKQIQTLLPRMGFEITGITYDATRKQNSILRAAKANTKSHVSSMYMGVPYDINFALNIYSRNIDDGTHIIEQILPFFNPDFTVTTNMVPELGLFKDTPIILNNVANHIEYEGNYDSVRYVNWTLNFTMKTYYYGPISYPKIIRTVYANIYNNLSLQKGYITKLNAVDMKGHFKLEDLVYQGDNYRTSNAYGIIMSVDTKHGKVMLGAVQGDFQVNNTVKCVSTNGTFRIESFETTNIQLAGIRITPNPIDAEPTEDYGYNIDMFEFPATDYNTHYINNEPLIITVDSDRYNVDSTTITIDTDI